MGREIVLFKTEEKKTPGEAAAILRQIADKIEAGSVTLQKGGESIRLDVPGTVTLEIKVEEEEKRRLKRSLEIEIEWLVGEAPESGVSIA